MTSFLRIKDFYKEIPKEKIKKTISKYFKICDDFINNDVINIRIYSMYYNSYLNIFEIMTKNNENQPIFIYVNVLWKYILIYDNEKRISFNFNNIVINQDNLCVFL